MATNSKEIGKDPNKDPKIEAPKAEAPKPVSDSRKQSLYFPAEMLAEIQLEANRQDRSMSWIVQQAWRLARDEIRRLPSVNDVIESRSTEPRNE